jgi:hypothetical protein
MAISNDLQLDQLGDLVIRDGDFVVSPCNNQNVLDIIVAAPGWWREYPTCGVAVENYQSGSGQQQQLESNIRLQLIADGFQVLSVRATPINETFTIAANVDRNV